MSEENVKIAKDWGSSMFPAEMSEQQKELKKKTGSYYRRDTKVGEYEVRKGRFV